MQPGQTACPGVVRKAGHSRRGHPETERSETERSETERSETERPEIERPALDLLLLLEVLGVLAQTCAILAELELGSAGLLQQGVVAIAGLLTDEEDDFFLLLGLCHDCDSTLER